MKRRFRRRPSRGQIVAAAIVACILLRFVYDLYFQSSTDNTLERFHEGPCEIVRVVDGDTVIARQRALSGQSITARVRLLGIDAPESVKPNHPVEPWGPEAASFAKEFLDGKKTRLRLDRHRLDQYGRLLAYVYAEDQMLNAELVRAGLARATIYPGNSATLERQLRAAQREAIDGRRGIWSESLK